MDEHFIKSIDLSLIVFNIFNRENIIDTIDRYKHDLESAMVWCGNK
jgi:hypothetical protein